MSRPLALIVLAAGLGKRTKVSCPKVLLPICGRTLLGSVLDTAAELQAAETVLVLHHGKSEVEKSLEGRSDLRIVDQGEPRGTGHAVQVAMRELAGFEGEVMILYGDVPLLRAETLQALRATRGEAAAIVLSAFLEDPSGMGRVLRGAESEFLGVREERDCSDDELVIDEINAGIYVFDAVKLSQVLDKLSDDNAQKEYYLTDSLELLLQSGARVEVVPVDDPEEVLGVNSLADLSEARAVMQERILLEHLGRGVIIEDPATTYIDHGVEIGANTRILPCSMIRSGVKIGAGCEVGPFAHLRAAAVMEDGAEVGNFVEVKKSRIGSGAKAKHLTYLGDASIGPRANIGAGTITANYDGKNKHQTQIGEAAFVGSGTVLVAPSSMGKGSKTGAGAIVTRNTEIGEGEVYIGVPARPLNKGKQGQAEAEQS
ncbi:MAG: bifunctional UDP-N-acetylglucosamine diphosphorylase/glucosamine-1-phosphate N-acetyltransferase GlmU [Planctomycetota bacterium]